MEKDEYDGMTTEEVSKVCGIPMSVLKAYERGELWGETQEAADARHYDETDMERLSLILTLHDAGFSGEEIRRYMRLLLSGGDSVQERMEMLREKRNGTLEELHVKQKQLDRLDYLRFAMARSSKSK